GQQRPWAAPGDESHEHWILTPVAGENKSATRPTKQYRERAPLSIRNRLASIWIEAASHMYGVGRGPASVLERLPETLACIVSGCTISREQRARENQLPSDQ